MNVSDLGNADCRIEGRRNDQHQQHPKMRSISKEKCRRKLIDYTKQRADHVQISDAMKKQYEQAYSASGNPNGGGATNGVPQVIEVLTFSSANNGGRRSDEKEETIQFMMKVRRRQSKQSWATLIDNSLPCARSKSRRFRPPSIFSSIANDRSPNSANRLRRSESLPIVPSPSAGDSVALTQT